MNHPKAYKKKITNLLVNSFVKFGSHSIYIFISYLLFSAFFMFFHLLRFCSVRFS